MPETTSDNARQEILEVKHLPPLSITATRLLEAVGNPDVEVEELSDIINHDPGLMGRIVGLANAAYFGQRNPIATVQEAIIRVLGINMVKSLALSISVGGVFQVNSCPGFKAQEYWFRAVGCATLSRMMALRVPIDDRPDPDRVYLSGLLHNIGHIVLAHLFPAKYTEVSALIERDGDVDYAALQREHLGVDWMSAGEWLAEHWHLPSFIGQTIRSVADPDSAVDDSRDILLVRSSIEWLNGFVTPENIETNLKESEALLQVPGLTPDALDVVEENFINQCEELRSLAACL